LAAVHWRMNGVRESAPDAGGVSGLVAGLATASVQSNLKGWLWPSGGMGSIF